MALYRLSVTAAEPIWPDLAAEPIWPDLAAWDGREYRRHDSALNCLYSAGYEALYGYSLLDRPAALKFLQWIRELESTKLKVGCVYAHNIGAVKLALTRES